MGPRRLAKLELARGHSGEPAHARRRPDAADRRAGDRRGGPAGWRSTTWPTRSRAALRAPVGLGRRARASGCPRTGAARARRAPRSRALNARHGPASGGGDRFLLLHRRRMWNAREGVWMGWERKRGKLREFNRLLRGATDTSFLPADPGAAPAPSGIRYVITLDADTRLPRGGGARAGRHDRASPQPARLRRRRVARRRGARAPPAAGDADAARDGLGHALPARLLGPAGHRPLRLRGVRRVPGPLRRGDLHRQGDLRRGRVRAGARRPGPGEHAALPRSLRGHLRPRRPRLGRRAVRGVSGRTTRSRPRASTAGCAATGSCCPGSWGWRPSAPGPPGNDAIPAIARWKMLDNLRRSLSPPATVRAARGRRGVCPARAPGSWTALVARRLRRCRRFSPSSASLLPKRRGVAKRSFLRGVAADLAIGLAQAALRLDAPRAPGVAACRTRSGARSGGVCVSRRHMLEWTPAAQAHRALDLESAGFYRRMRGALVLAAGAAALLAASGTPAWGLRRAVSRGLGCSRRSSLVDEPAAAPDASARLSPKRRPPRSARSPGARGASSRRSRTAEDHGLPPDNFQEEPQPVVARRTSPTNIGLCLLSTVAAHDFGWIGTVEMAERLEAALAAIGRLERFRGHLYNWYDTTDLAPLEPRYVSTVDSGNLAAHLLVLKQACLGARGRAGPVGPRPRRDRRHARCSCAARRRRSPAAAPLASSRRGSSRRRSARRARCSLRCRRRRPSGRRALAALAVCAETLVDIVRALARTTARPRRGPALGVGRWRSRAAIGEPRARRPRRRDEIAASPPSPSRDGWPPSRATADRLVAGDGLHVPVRRVRGSSSRSATVRRTGALDSGYYDLLASEARLASFVAIAAGDVPVEHWFHLGRPLTPVGRGSALLSWSGSMFEYLMPDLVLDAAVGQPARAHQPPRRAAGRSRYGRSAACRGASPSRPTTRGT